MSKAQTISNWVLDLNLKELLWDVVEQDILQQLLDALILMHNQYLFSL